MKHSKWVIALALILSFPCAALADHGMAGCGLGTLVFKGKDKTTQIFVATTNGTFGSQTFGITSGTSNCTQDGTVATNAEQKAFMEVNYVQVSHDAAMGGGEYLTALATLFGCENAVQPAFFKMTQSHFEQIFPVSATPDEALKYVKSIVAQDETLSQSCTNI